MKPACLRPNQFTLASGINPCANLMCLQCASQVQAMVIKAGLEQNSFIELALIEIYAKVPKVWLTLCPNSIIPHLGF